MQLKAVIVTNETNFIKLLKLQVVLIKTAWNLLVPRPWLQNDY